MSVRTFVGFVADFPTEHNDTGPPGQELGAFVAQRLSDSGFTVGDIANREDWAWEFHTIEGQLEIMTIIGLVDDMASHPPRQWLITNDCRTGLFKRLFGGKGIEHTRQRFLRRFCEALHDIISHDSRFAHVVWYDKDTFDKPGDQPGSAP